jgi:hypothetical protein
MSCNDDVLSDHQVILCKQIEFFVAQQIDLITSLQVKERRFRSDKLVFVANIVLCWRLPNDPEVPCTFHPSYGPSIKLHRTWHQFIALTHASTFILQ